MHWQDLLWRHLYKTVHAHRGVTRRGRAIGEECRLYTNHRGLGTLEGDAGTEAVQESRPSRYSTLSLLICREHLEGFTFYSIGMDGLGKRYPACLVVAHSPRRAGL